VDSSHHVARFSGQKFTVIIPEWGEEEVKKLAAELRMLMEETKFENEDKVPRGKITVSIAAVFYPRHGTTRKELLENLKQSMSSAKRSGGNCLKIVGE
jgi:diguanylate cyclase (GGDEF)-like protein